MSASIRVADVVDQVLSVDRLLGLVTEPAVGGVGLFVGVVRDHDQGLEVDYLDYTAHPSAADAIRRVAEEVASAYDVRTVAVEHRSGHLVVGDLAVVVAVGAEHRGAALAACAELINRIKASVPIWKEQHFTSGTTDWVGLP